MSDELKPCPFCGGEARIVTAVGVSWVLCDKCKTTTEAHTDRQFAITAWNRRVTEYRKPTTLSQLEDENAKLRELVRWMYDRMDESCAVHHTYAPAPISYDLLMKALARVHELGIEVDD